MSEVAVLFAERSSVPDLAGETRIPAPTIYAWKRKGAIPVWRRPAVLGAIQRLGWDIPADVIAYLAKGA